MANREVLLTLEDAVAEVLQTLTGLDLEYEPEMNRFRSITRTLNRALRAVALEHDWSVYTVDALIGKPAPGMTSVEMNRNLRPRISEDDSVRLVDDDGNVRVWAYYLPRDALAKYGYRRGLWVSVVRNTLYFSRPFQEWEKDWNIVVPAMREPTMFRLPKNGETVSAGILRQPVDFDYPDLIVAKACQLVASSDPVMQPRVQTLEAYYKDLMYQLIERDTKFNDSPYQNDFMVPIKGSLNEYPQHPYLHKHPHADERWW